MVLSWTSINMKEFYYTDKFLNKTLSVIKKNIDDENIKTEVFSVNLESGPNTRSNYLKTSLNKKEYGYVLDEIMEYFIENEWYEDCIEIKDYKDKLNKLQQDEKRPTRTETRAVEAEL